ncbi:MAG: hypothetical protein UX47_C0010G0024 [Candidatus Collierbacteria bacterium GW2011_GWA2_46_26]|uniref:Uncharacterized protein n=1 Tax=Candidatus Collierbacteria bacterium GW2011_GWA2_46_26 TaxID=1618381 RepID=A0A0G1RRC0_9BACT|nr:MAG: hypothetical protein UW29_C0010G0024 [Candidatus Collierbacteria bacterium GW2011_GWC2_44_13]KKU32508.1 MAG: hypothetical protein UX47_C0010G0024 [Candidatus Collierbacteria bacterium GW2011_GWA2_46_26]
MKNTVINIRLTLPQDLVEGFTGLNCASVFAYINP